MANPDLQELRRAARQSSRTPSGEAGTTTLPITPTQKPSRQSRPTSYSHPVVREITEYDAPGALFWIWWLLGPAASLIFGLLLTDEWLWIIGLVILSLNLVFALFTNGYTRGSAAGFGAPLAIGNGVVVAISTGAVMLG